MKCIAMTCQFWILCIWGDILIGVLFSEELTATQSNWSLLHSTHTQTVKLPLLLLITYTLSEIIIIIIDNFLYSTVFCSQVLTVLVAWDSKWMTLYSTFCIATEAMYLQCCVVVTGLMPCKTAAVLVHALCIPYNHAPVHSVISFEATCIVIITSMPVCLVVTCHLHFQQNDSDLLWASVVTWG